MPELNVASVSREFLHESPFEEKKTKRTNIPQKGYFSSCLGDCMQELVRVCRANDISEAAAGCLVEGPRQTLQQVFLRHYQPWATQSMYEIPSDLSDAPRQKKDPVPIPGFRAVWKGFRGHPGRPFFWVSPQRAFTPDAPPTFTTTLEVLYKATSYKDYLANKRAIWRNGSRGALFLPRGAIFKKGEDAFQDLASVKKGLSLQYDLWHAVV